jgi:hypothetical protein
MSPVVCLRLLFVVVLASMLAITGWASSHTPLFEIPAEVLKHPWFLATLLDAYWAFIAFYVWIAWKEQSLAARLLWFVAVIALGNIAMAIYMLRELFRPGVTDSLDVVFTRRNPGHLVLPAIVATAGVSVYLLA